MKGRVPNKCFGAALEDREYPGVAYSCLLPFSPSNQQLKAYGEHAGHKLVVNYKNSPPSVTFDNDALRTLRGRYPKDTLYPLVEDWRVVEKALGTYVGGLTPREDGRYGEEFTHKPKTLRLAMKLLQLLPNSGEVQTFKDRTYGRVRELMVAAPGHVLHARDYGGLELKLVAYFAGIKELLRLACSDAHGFIASHAIGKPADLGWSDADLVGYLDEFKKENREWEVNGIKRKYKTIRNASKRSIYLTNYLGTAKRMVQSEPETFGTVKQAQWYQDLYYDLFPGVKTWQWATCEEAEQKGYVTTPDGFRQWHFDPFKYTYDKGAKRWAKDYGENAKEVVACKPQHMGMMFSAYAITELFNIELVKPSLRLSIHDEILLESQTTVWQDIDALTKTAMEREMRCMPMPPSWGMGEFLAIATTGKRSEPGGSWASMKE